ncbi:hypothetical protein PCPL58_4591 [Pseudomonas cerasi]|nr:hypothetical protein PCPL58_4591 [Pseudomonas cerasi]SOS23423.1 hypothetical protein PL963_04692 [Pseudomonas cerasi]
MLARQYGLGDALHQCATVVEVEELLLRTFFRHAFNSAHPLVQMPRASVRAMSWDIYAAHVDALAERLTVAAFFKTAQPDEAPGAVKGLLGAIRQAPVQRLLTHFGTALRPGYSALIPTVAIVFYARVTLDDDALM